MYTDIIVCQKTVFFSLDLAVQHNPDQIMRNVNLLDPEELEVHIQVFDVHQRSWQRRWKMIQCFTILVVLIVVAFLVWMRLTTKTGNENSMMYGGGKCIDKTGSRRQGWIPIYQKWLLQNTLRSHGMLFWTQPWMYQHGLCIICQMQCVKSFLFVRDANQSPRCLQESLYYLVWASVHVESHEMCFHKNSSAATCCYATKIAEGFVNVSIWSLITTTMHAIFYTAHRICLTIIYIHLPWLKIVSMGRLKTRNNTASELNVCRPIQLIGMLHVGMPQLYWSIAKGVWNVAFWSPTWI